MILYITAGFCIIYSVLSAVSIYGKYKDKKLHLYTKSIPVVLLAVFLLVNLAVYKSNYTFTLLVFAGLCAGFIGDYFLSFDTKYFIQGLASFLIGHVLYISAFMVYAGFALYPLFYLIIGGISLTYLIFFFLLLKKEMEILIRIAIVIYVVLLSLMVMSAFHLDRQPGLFPLILTGAFLFYISDAVLAIHLFHKEAPLNHFIILSAYYGAQLCITMAVLLRLI